MLIVGAGYTVPCKVSNEIEEETDVMRKLSIIVIALCVCTAFAVAASAQEKTLCERLGGTLRFQPWSIVLLARC